MRRLLGLACACAARLTFPDYSWRAHELFHRPTGNTVVERVTCTEDPGEIAGRVCTLLACSSECNFTSLAAWVESEFCGDAGPPLVVLLPRLEN
jgi:hypothetical protein